MDYEQIELRLTAHFGNEEQMIEDIHEGKDLHSETCKRIFEIDESAPDWKSKRYLAKTLNFSIVYGTGAAKFAETVLKSTGGKMRISEQEARSYISSWKSAHLGVMELFNKVAHEVALTGGVRNYYGRFVPVDPGKPYVGVNYLIQGTAADLMKDRLLKCWRFLKDKDTDLLMTIHDELVFEVPGHEKEIIWQLKEIMEEPDEFKVPLTCSVEVGKTWGSKKAFEPTAPSQPPSSLPPRERSGQLYSGACAP